MKMEQTLDTPAEEDQAAAVVVVVEGESVAGVGVVENGVRVSVDKNTSSGIIDQSVEGNASVEVVHDQGSEGGGAEDQVGVGRGGGGGEVSVVDESEKDDVLGKVVVVVKEEEGLKENASLQFNGDGEDDDLGSIRKVEISGEDISLVVEVQGGSANCMVEQENISNEEVVCKLNSISRSGSEVGEIRNGDQRSLLFETTHDKDDEDVLPETTKDETVKDEEKQVEERGEKEDEEEEEEGKEEEEEHNDGGFSVGDLVWAKIKSHPWWPGLIYDPSDASESAAKYHHRKDRLLVAYFGDHSFAWCDPSQLKPFQENFEKMSMQSNSESFLYAVEASLDEIGRRVELEMTCSCVPEENRTEHGGLLTVNAGINEGVAVPVGGSGEFSVTQFEPVKFLAHLRCIAQFVSITNMLEVTVLRRRLLAFNRTRGYNQLPLYDGPQGTTAPEDGSGDRITSKSNFNGQGEELTQRPPEADWLVNPEFGKISTRNWPGISEDKLYQRKKQRTMAEIMADDMDVEPENCGGGATEEEGASKPMSTSRKRKKNKDSEVGTDGDLAEDGSGSGKSDPTSKKLKKTKLSGSPSVIEEEKVIDGKNSDIGGREGSKTRERKKSKYLSYPYTSLSKETNYFLSWVDPVNEIPKKDRVVDVDGQLTGSPPIVKCSGETFQTKLAKNSPGSLNHQTPNKQKKIALKNAKVSPVEMLSEILFAALDPFYLKENNSYRSVKGFFAAFRGSLYRDGFNYETFNNYMADRCNDKKQSPDNKPISPVKDTHETDHKKSNGESKPKRKRRKKDETMLQSLQTESEHATGTVEPKRKRKMGKDEAKLRSPQSKSAHEAGTVESKPKKIKRKDQEAMLQSPQSKFEHEVGGVESKPEEIKTNDEAILQSPQSKLEPKAGTTELKRKRIRRKKDGARLQSPQSKQEHEAGKVESKRKRIRRKDEARLQNPESKLEHATGTVKQTYNKKANGESSGAALLLTFAPGVSLPSKDDLLTVFGKFGDLNVLETEVLQDSSSAQVVYVRTSDAETAFNSKGKISQFGTDTVTYQLRYLPTTSKASKHDGNSNQVLPTPLPSVVGDETPTNQSASRPPPASEAPPLLFIRQNLEMMTSLLERSGDNLSPGTRAKLEGEIKGLLKKVATMSADSSSS